MSYLLDKKIKRKKLSYIFSFVFLCIILFYFQVGIINGLSYVSHKVFSPILFLGNNIGEKFTSFGSFFISKKSLYLENQDLKSTLDIDRAKMSNYDSILAENISLKEISGRKNENVPMVLGVILSKPNQSPYGTLVIDVGLKDGLKSGDQVFALGNVPIGTIAETYVNSSKVTLFSNSGQKTQVVVGQKNEESKAGKSVFMEIVGRGGGNFEMILPRDFTLQKGDQVLLPGINNLLVGIVETILSDPREPFIKALIVSPVNVQELKFVEVEVK